MQHQELDRLFAPKWQRQVSPPPMGHRSMALMLLLCMLAPAATRSDDSESRLVADLLAAGVPAGKGRSLLHVLSSAVTELR